MRPSAIRLVVASATEGQAALDTRDEADSTKRLSGTPVTGRVRAHLPAAQPGRRVLPNGGRGLWCM